MTAKGLAKSSSPTSDAKCSQPLLKTRLVLDRMFGHNRRTRVGKCNFTSCDETCMTGRLRPLDVVEEVLDKIFIRPEFGQPIPVNLGIS